MRQLYLPISLKVGHRSLTQNDIASSKVCSMEDDSTHKNGRRWGNGMIGNVSILRMMDSQHTHGNILMAGRNK